MEKYNEIITKSLIDFEEIKLVFANNNIELINSLEVKEKYFIDKKISFKRANYKKIIENCYVLSYIDQKIYLTYTSKKDYQKNISKIEVISEEECVDFLNHIGFDKVFEIEKNIYEYTNHNNKIRVINLIGIGLYLSVRKDGANEDELRVILSSFNLPYDEFDCDVSFEKLAINKTRRYLK